VVSCLQWARLLEAMTATDPTDRPTASRTSLALREITAADLSRRRAPWIIEDAAVDVRARS
jgi:hypothetical protein